MKAAAADAVVGVGGAVESGVAPCDTGGVTASHGTRLSGDSLPLTPPPRCPAVAAADAPAAPPLGVGPATATATAAPPAAPPAVDQGTITLLALCCRRMKLREMGPGGALALAGGGLGMEDVRARRSKGAVADAAAEESCAAAADWLKLRALNA